MKRRGAIVVLLALAAMPTRGRAQEGANVPKVGWLGLTSPQGTSYLFDVFKQGIREGGLVEGRDFVVEDRWASGHADRLPQLAAELVALRPRVIFATYQLTGRALAALTSTIPIVVGDVGPPGDRLVKNFARPEANVTGFLGFVPESALKQFELLLEILPKGMRVGVLRNPAAIYHRYHIAKLQAAAGDAGVPLVVVEAGTPAEIEKGIALLGRERVRAVILLPDPLFIQQRRLIAERVAQERLASVSAYHEDAEAGALLSYGEDLADRFRRSGVLVARIVKGAKPAELPVEQASKLELVVNLKTAKMLGLEISPSVLLRADRLIE